MNLSRLLEQEAPSSEESEIWHLSSPTDTWKHSELGIWSLFVFGEIPLFGWKIHVSATLNEAPKVLEIASKIAFNAGCSFKHLRGRSSFITLHFKNASRLQSGKFIALYPPNTKSASLILEELYHSLRHMEGVDVLTDRKYKDSTCVFYRWGAFIGSGRINDKGEPEELVLDGRNQWVPDVRLPRFTLPDGILDPFSPTLTESHVLVNDAISLDDFKVESVLRFTNAGGRYRGTCRRTGIDVVIKEARPNTGFVGSEDAITRLRREVSIINKVNTTCDTLAPTFLKKFTVQKHEYAVFAYLPGVPLSEWIARENPLYSSLHGHNEHVSQYFSRASRILNSVTNSLNQLHEIGIAFGDLSLGNIIIDETDSPRFIDFEACTTIDNKAPGLRTPDFCMLSEDAQISAKERDLYSLDCVAVALVLRLTSLAEISKSVFQEITADLVAASHTPPHWWSDACGRLESAIDKRSVFRAETFSSPSLDKLDDRKLLKHLLARGAAECYMPDTPSLFPTSSTSRRGANLSFGFGCSGVLFGLKANGMLIDPMITSHFAESVEHSLDAKNLPLNYDVGTAGLIDTCAALNLNMLTKRILLDLNMRWTELHDPTLGRGLSGIALTLQRHGFVGLAEEMMSSAIRAAPNYPWEKNGLLYGRSGVIASACQFSAMLKAEPELSRIVRQLLADEFSQTVRHPKGASLSLRSEVDGTRILPYLADGSAGLLLAMLFANSNENIDFSISSNDAIALALDLVTPFMLEGSLMDGAAGLAVTLELARRSLPSYADDLPDPGWRRIRKYLLPLNSGIGVLHPGTLRFDLSHSKGSLGILQALLWADGESDLNLSGLYLRTAPTSVVA